MPVHFAGERPPSCLKRRQTQQALSQTVVASPTAQELQDHLHTSEERQTKVEEENVHLRKALQSITAEIESVLDHAVCSLCQKLAGPALWQLTCDSRHIYCRDCLFRYMGLFKKRGKFKEVLETISCPSCGQSVNEWRQPNVERDSLQLKLSRLESAVDLHLA